MNTGYFSQGFFIEGVQMEKLSLIVMLVSFAWIIFAIQNYHKLGDEDYAGQSTWLWPILLGLYPTFIAPIIFIVSFACYILS